MAEKKLDHPSGTHWCREPKLVWSPISTAPCKYSPLVGHGDGPPIIVRSKYFAYAVVLWSAGAWHHPWNNRLLEFEPVEWAPIVPHELDRDLA